MKKRFTLLVAMVMLLTAMATNVFASSADNNSELSPKELQEWFDGLSKEEQLRVNYNLLQSLRLSDKDIEWLKWYNTLSKEQQWAVNYFPSQLLKVFSASEVSGVSKVNFDDLKVNEDIINEDENKKTNTPAKKAGNNAKTGIAGVAGVAGILTAALVAYRPSKKD